MTAGSTLIASISATGDAIPAPSVNTNIDPTARTTERWPDKTAANSTKAASTLTALAPISSGLIGAIRTTRLAIMLPTQTPRMRIARFGPTSPIGRCNSWTKMNGAAARNAYIDVVAQPPPIAKAQKCG